MEPYEEAAGRLATDSNIDGPPFSNKMRNASANDLSADMMIGDEQYLGYLSAW
jgi:hypothetical protein